MKRERLPKWADDLSANARNHLRDWLNPKGWWDFGKEGGRLRQAQNELISAGLMVVDEDSPDQVRLSGKAAKMKPL